MTTFRQAIRQIKTELLLLNKRMGDMEKEIKEINKDHVTKEDKEEQKGPTLEELEEFAEKHFDYVGALEDFVKTHENYLRELYQSDFIELKEFTEENDMGSMVYENISGKSS